MPFDPFFKNGPERFANQGTGVIAQEDLYLDEKVWKTL